MKSIFTWAALGCLSISTTLVSAQTVQTSSSRSTRTSTSSTHVRNDGSQPQGYTDHQSVTVHHNDNNGTRDRSYSSHRSVRNNNDDRNQRYGHSRTTHIRVSQQVSPDGRSREDKTTTTTRHDVRP